MSTQLEKDISRKLDERIKQACRDHMALCELAEIGPREALDIMFSTISAFLVDGMSKLLVITPEDWGKAMAGAMRMAQDLNQKRASA